MPKAVYLVANPLMKAILRSPLHRLLSNSLMVLTFTGRHSRKRYSIPVGYVERRDRLFVFSHSAWSNNFRGGSPVSLRLRGKEIRGTANIIEDRERIAEIVGIMVAKHGEEMARRMRLIVDGQDAPRGTTFIEIALEDR